MARNGDGGGTAGLKTALQFVDEKQVAHLGHAIAQPTAIAALGIEVVEVDAAHAMALAADGHNACVWGCVEAIEQQTGERKVGEVVGAELHFETIDGGALG